jgi:hypothetical protein
VISDRRLKQTILEFAIRGEAQLIMNVGRIERGDVYWPAPNLSLEDAVKVARERFSYPKLEQKDGDGRASGVIRFSGCTPVCQVLQDKIEIHISVDFGWDAQNGWRVKSK